MSDLRNLSVTEALDLLLKKEITALELTEAYLAAEDPYNAFIIKTPELAIKQAKRSDERIQNNTAGILEGIPIGVKDLFCTEGVQTTAGSRMLEGFIPHYESTVTSYLYANGGICLGKTNMDEFAMGSSNTTSYYGPVINPLRSLSEPDKKLVPGGSSGGSAAAVAGNLCKAALGSDTGGSIRQPASFCGLVGFKPSYGRVSRWGMVAFASSLDQAGPITKTVADAALVGEAIAGYDPKDSTSVNLPVPEWSHLLNQGVKGMKIGIPKEYKLDGIEKEIIAAWEEGIKVLKEAGATILDITLPHTNQALPVYYTIAPAEASSNLARYDGVRYGLRITRPDQDLPEMISETRAAGFGKEVKRRILIGTYVLSAAAYGAYYVKAQQIRRLIYNDFMEAFKKVNVILTPTTPSVAFGLNDNQKDPLQMYLNDIFTIPASLAGLPTLSVPTAKKDGLPLSLQMIARPFDETAALRVGKVLEKGAS
jgi:aspartyl-tRNA(Asn)/glutamyl-tRNA(Gln) amidotransferase subunit A